MKTPHELDLIRIEDQARVELEREEFAAAVERRKAELRQHRSLWHKLFPWKIVITRR